VFHFDLGFSPQAGQSVADLLKPRVWTTVLLGLYANVFGLLIAIPLAVTQAYRRDRAFDKVGSMATFIAVGIPGIVLGVLTADCAPVLLCDAEAGVIGAAHAGWKGALSGVTDSTVAAMEALGAQRARIAAVVGPCIAQRSYEVDAGFEARFLEQAPENARFFKAGRAGHVWFDLEGYTAARLRDAGIGQIGLLGEDTYAQEDRFYSFRRATHRAEPGYGRQISLIGLAAR
jgi:YfiH family protein